MNRAHATDPAHTAKPRCAANPGHSADPGYAGESGYGRRPGYAGRPGYLVDAVRAPIGRYSGGLAAVRPDDLAAHTLSALLPRTPGLDPARIEDVCIGVGQGLALVLER